MQGTMEANEILLQAYELPQHRFDIHLTPREENAKGKRNSTSMEMANPAEEGREARLRDGAEIKNRPCVALFGLSWDPGCTKSHSYTILCVSLPSLPTLLKCTLLFCPAPSPGASRGIPAQWGPYNWEPCLLFSPLPLASLPFHFFPHWYPLSFALWTYGSVFKREPSPHQSLRLSRSICFSFPQLFPLR